MITTSMIAALYVLVFISQDKRKYRLLNLLIALDSFLYVVLTLGIGYPSETFSSAAYRAEKQGRFYGKARPFIDWLFHRLEQDHCKLSYEYAVNKYNLPEDMR